MINPTNNQTSSLVTDESVLVAANCVVSEGEAQADDGPREKSHKHGLEVKYLFHVYFSICAGLFTFSW